jgi:sugar lactone lactonase YvrE
MLDSADATAWQADVLARGFTWPQSPRWIEGKLFVSDIHHGRVVSVDDGGEVSVELEKAYDVTPPFIPCGLLPTAGDTLVVSMAENTVVSLASGEVVIDLSAAAHSVRPTDLVVAPTGHIFVSQIGFEIAAGGEWAESPLIRVGPDSHVDVADEGGTFMITSGLGILPDDETLIVTEVGKAALHALTIGADGSLTDRRVYAELDVHGMCIDAEGGVWVAQTGSRQCVRVAPGGGSITDRIDLPEGGSAVACALGGRDGKTLFITMGIESLDADKSRNGLGGLIVAARVDVPGQPVRVHGGFRA